MTTESRLSALERDVAVLREQRGADRRDHDQLERVVEDREKRDRDREDSARKQRIANYFALAALALTFLGLLIAYATLIGATT